MIFLLMPACFLLLWSYDVMESGDAELPCSAAGRSTVMGSEFHHSTFIYHRVWGAGMLLNAYMGPLHQIEVSLSYLLQQRFIFVVGFIFVAAWLWTLLCPFGSQLHTEVRAHKRICLLAMQHWEEIIKPNYCGQRRKNMVRGTNPGVV